jgi:hypothetical protein
MHLCNWNSQFAIGLQTARKDTFKLYDAVEGRDRKLERKPGIDVIEADTGIIKRGIMNTNERMIRFVFISGFLAVLVLEVWLLFRAVELFL